MHILTKIFVVLVSLLAVLLVPLVVVYAYNEDSYKAKHDAAVATANANAADLDAAKACVSAAFGVSTPTRATCWTSRRFLS